MNPMLPIKFMLNTVPKIFRQNERKTPVDTMRERTYFYFKTRKCCLKVPGRVMQVQPIIRDFSRKSTIKFDFVDFFYYGSSPAFTLNCVHKYMTHMLQPYMSGLEARNLKPPVRLIRVRSFSGLESTLIGNS